MAYDGSTYGGGYDDSFRERLEFKNAQDLKQQEPNYDTNMWLWDMIDEFIYQFHSYCQYRATLKTKTKQELALLWQYAEVWKGGGSNVLKVLGYFCILLAYYECIAS
ncbi:hypothetical protein L7F22_022641 [Adiantum nelumboides]|nr:hypothetical protein [Adiantum nelumboides]